MSNAKEKKKSGMTFPLFLLLLLALAGIGAGVWLMITKMTETEPSMQHEVAMYVGDRKTLEVSLVHTYDCISSDEKIVTVDPETHLISALSVGSATLTATDTSNNKKEIFMVTVSEDPDHPGTAVTTTTTTTEVTTTTTETTTTEATTVAPGVVSGISLTYYSANIKVGTVHPYAKVTMTPADAKDKSEIWTSSDESVATVDRAGRITGKKPGKCVVRVTSVSNPNVFADIDVTVVDANGNTGEAAVTTTVTTAASETVTAAQSSQTSASTTSQTAANLSNPLTPAAPQSVAATPEIKTVNGVTYVNGVLIANKTYALPKSYAPGLTKETKAAFLEMQAAAAKEGKSLSIKSGYRSYETQQTLYNNYVARDGKAAADRYSARPGHSEHQTGLAIDINRASDAFTKTPEAKWLAENCWKYGFIIRYPEGKESITGYKYESWHVRYLGKELAKAVYESGLTLEEYLGITSVYQN